MKLLWLASWYPNPEQPFDGDFIQRHARAVALHIPVTVFYVAQYGHQVNINEASRIDRQHENVEEKIIFFRFRKTGIGPLDKLRYNYLYYRCYKKALKDHFRKHGLPDLVHVHIPMKAGIIGQWICRTQGIPYVVSEHSSLYSNDAPGNFFTRNFIHRLRVRKVFRNAKGVSSVSATIGRVLENVFGIRGVKTIHNTVNTEFFNYRPKAIRKFRFIHVSTLTEQKNPQGILRVVAMLARQRQDFELVIVGPALDELKKMAGELSLKQLVTFAGEVSYEEVAAQMQEASVLLLFSRHENFPCVIVEALCCGLPCIAANVGGVAEAVNDENGILISPGDEDELLRAMNSMLDRYQYFDREKIAARARQLYSYGVIGQQFNDWYSEVLQNISSS